jgi:hypothetical protein
VDGKRQDYRFDDGLNKIFNLLENATDTEMVTKYGLWLVERDRDLGLRVSMLSSLVKIDKAKIVKRS